MFPGAKRRHGRTPHPSTSYTPTPDAYCDNITTGSRQMSLAWRDCEVTRYVAPSRFSTACVNTEGVSTWSHRCRHRHGNTGQRSQSFFANTTTITGAGVRARRRHIIRQISSGHRTPPAPLGMATWRRYRTYCHQPEIQSTANHFRLHTAKFQPSEVTARSRDTYHGRMRPLGGTGNARIVFGFLRSPGLCFRAYRCRGEFAAPRRSAGN